MCQAAKESTEILNRKAIVKKEPVVTRKKCQIESEN